MENAKKELLEVLEECTAKIKCASIKFGWDLNCQVQKTLKVNYSQKDYDEFLNSLDFTYDDDYGTQYLYGIVWLEDDTWLSRMDYDGFEWWQHNILPSIPNECL